MNRTQQREPQLWWIVVAFIVLVSASAATGDDTVLWLWTAVFCAYHAGFHIGVYNEREDARKRG